jgi:uncharacterized protein
VLGMGRGYRPAPTARAIRCRDTSGWWSRALRAYARRRAHQRDKSVIPTFELTLLGAGAAGIGALGGLGGAVLLVPALVLLGVPPLEAAPLGVLTVAAGSLAAGPRQVSSGLVHHRLGIVTELAASAGAFAGALASTAVSGPILVRVLGLAALLAGLAGLVRRGRRNPVRGEFAAEGPGEWPGSLGGSYKDPGGIVPYGATRLRLGLAGMGVAGILAGLVGLGGGVLKTPVLAEVMHVPVKVAAATSLFTVGITSAVALIVFAAQDRLDTVAGAAVVSGALIGGWLAGRVQERIGAVAIRRIVGVLIIGVGLLLLVRG